MTPSPQAIIRKDRPSIQQGMRLSYMKPGTVMGATKGNYLIALFNAMVNLKVVPGSKNEFILSELNSMLSVDIANSGEGASISTGTYRGGFYENLLTTTPLYFGDTVAVRFSDGTGNIYYVTYLMQSTLGGGPYPAVTDNPSVVPSDYWPTGAELYSYSQNAINPPSCLKPLGFFFPAGYDGSSLTAIT